MAGFGEVQEQYTKDLERDLKQARKEINELKIKLKEADEEFFTLVNNMGYFTQRDLMNGIKKVMVKLKEKGE